MKLTPKIFWEFFRYLFAGGAAFVVDFGTLIACRELLFGDVAYGVYASVLIAFFAGHITNYILSLLFVFRDPEERRKGWTWSAFGLFAVVGAMGVGITELGMWIGYGLLHFNYILMKIVMAATVFVFNFIGRKLLCGLEAARALLGLTDKSALWDVNTEKEYHETK